MLAEVLPEGEEDEAVIASGAALDPAGESGVLIGASRMGKSRLLRMLGDESIRSA